MDLLGPGSMTSTHTGNPVCCAAALASIDLIVGENLVEKARSMGALLHARLRAIQKPHPANRLRCSARDWWQGSSASSRRRREPDGELAWDIVRRCIEKGVLMFSPVGFGGSTVKIAPPLCITEEALRESLAASRRL